MREIQGTDPARGLGPIIDGALHALPPSGLGELGVDVPPLEHRVPKDGRLRWGECYRAHMELWRTGHRVGGVQGPEDPAQSPPSGGASTGWPGRGSLRDGPRKGGPYASQTSGPAQQETNAPRN